VLVERTPAVLVEVGVERRGDVAPDRAQTVERLGKLVGGIDALRAQRVDELTNTPTACMVCGLRSLVCAGSGLVSQCCTGSGSG
jgi:hypothetical protein